MNLLIETLCVSCWTAYILQDDTRSLQYQVENEMFPLIFCTNLSETFLILMRIQGNVILNVHRSSCKTPVILVRF